MRLMGPRTLSHHSLTVFEVTSNVTAINCFVIFCVGGCLSELLDASIATAAISDSH